MATLQKLQFNNRTILTSGRDSFVAFNIINPSEYLDKFYPVGTYYTTMDANFDPNVSFVGTWVRDTDGLVLRSDTASTLESGGELTHAITVDEMPSHIHRTTRQLMQSGKVNSGTRGNDTFTGKYDYWTHVYNSGTTKPYKYGSRTSTASNNTSESHNNVQQSMICYRWHRTV